MSERAPADLLEGFKFALDQSAIVAITDTAGRITYANDYFCRISKYSREELIGQDHRLVNSGFHPKEFMRGLWETIRAGQVWKGEIRNRAKDGTFYWVDTTIVPFLDESGRPWQYLAIRADITERKRAEQRLFEQGALVKLGEMAAVVAHEVKNPLAGIAGAIQVIEGRLPEGSGERAVVGEIQARIRALNATVEDLLLFARPRLPRPGPLPVHLLVEALLPLLAKDPQAAGVTVESTVEDVAVWGDAEMLKAVLLNVLINGAQAMGGRGCIRIESRCSDEVCELSVTDAGPGIPAELRDRVFEPFFTTKHRGTGLGLSIARRVMEAHAGAIRLECPAGGGTTVTLALPLHRSPEGARVDSTDLAGPAGARVPPG
jgi:PAS domain S-box-containing protein